MPYLIRDIETGAVETVTIKRLLEIINDPICTSSGWTPYDATDWREGWDEWAENDSYNLIGILTSRG